jgi:hypothetical protein
MARRLRIPKARTLRTILDRSHLIGCHLGLEHATSGLPRQAGKQSQGNAHTRSAATGLPSCRRRAKEMTPAQPPRIPAIVATRGLILAERSEVHRTAGARSVTGMPVSADQVWMVAARVRALP